MPHIKINGCNYYYEIHGNGPETIVFSHGLLWSTKLFHKQIAHLKDRYTIVAYDHRGQGKSEVTKYGYDMDQLAEDAAALIKELELGSVHFAGLSMGGFVGLRLAARQQQLIKSLILMETSAQKEVNSLKYYGLISIVNLFGVASVQRPTMKIMFGDTFLNDKSRRTELKEWRNELLKNKKSVSLAVKGVIQRKGMEDELRKILCPTLIMVGTEDKATKPVKSKFMHERIRHSELVYIKNGGHTSAIEEPDQYNIAIDNFLSSLNSKTRIL